MTENTRLFRSSFKIYFSHTDIGGVVYYANYLMFAEHARSDLLEELGFPELQWAKKEKIGFIVRKVDLDLIKPLTLNDKIEVVTEVIKINNTSVQLKQTVENKEKGYLAASMDITLVCVNILEDGLKPIKIPEKLTKSLLT